MTFSRFKERRPMASVAHGDQDQSRLQRQVSVERLIPAAAARIFDLLADPAAHSLFDGSGTVIAGHPRNPQRLTMGARFTMDMRHRVAYRMWNTVVEFEEDRRIAWRHAIGHHVWRYELEPVTATTTLVRETFDWTTCRTKWLIRVLNWETRNEQSMRVTLERLSTLLEPVG
ncbi:SRPBCC family protein [Actinoplanes sp. NEAU-A12]|uniref:SRPBCC family protein n=1 Tax=Actinoplanes sandaracinus TaxID=3045177 RepID=A0ABT6WSK5_9ACTN|nr:SRPBCC family protein [Actinoplanes sandaracinus]MDI6102723.1 SRPBCC family protein [Actinoplanes sandaracinus]